MANWIGGSCPAMANQIAGGFCSVTAATLRGFLPTELPAFKLELEKQLAAQREVVRAAEVTARALRIQSKQ